MYVWSVWKRGRKKDVDPSLQKKNNWIGMEYGEENIWRKIHRTLEAGAVQAGLAGCVQLPVTSHAPTFQWLVVSRWGVSVIGGKGGAPVPSPNFASQSHPSQCMYQSGTPSNSINHTQP